MSKRTDFALGKCELFSKTLYSRELTHEKKIKYFTKDWRGS